MVLPRCTLLRNLFTECYDGNLTFARQIGSYPLLVGIPGKLPLNKFIDAKIIDYGYRSVTAIPYPLDINSSPRETIEALPHIGKKRSTRIINSRPFKNYQELANSLDDQDLIKDLKIFLGNELLTS